MSAPMEDETSLSDSSEVSTCVMLPPGWEVAESAIYNDGMSDFFAIVCRTPLTKRIESWPSCLGCSASVVIKDGMINMTVRIPAWELPDYVS